MKKRQTDNSKAEPPEFSNETEIDMYIKKLGEMFLNTAQLCGIDSYPASYITTSIQAMLKLQKAGRDNVILKLPSILTQTFPEGAAIMPLYRMPWGLIEYNISIKSATHVS